MSTINEVGLTMADSPKLSDHCDEVMEIALPNELAFISKYLVARFAEVVGRKLLAFERSGKDWTDVGWMDECRRQLREQMEKGDPLDVAVYCSFLWWHANSTNQRVADDARRYGDK